MKDLSLEAERFEIAGVDMTGFDFAALDLMGRPDDWEKCARAGLSLKLAAKLLGRSHTTGSKYASANGLKFARHPRQPHAPVKAVPFDDSEIDACACRDLWTSVLHEQIVTAWAGRRADVAARDAARRWFDTPDFRTVCALIGFDPDYILRARGAYTRPSSRVRHA